MIPLSRPQKEIMKEFYDIAPTKVIFNKNDRDKIWIETKNRDSNLDLEKIRLLCPAMEHQIKKSYDSGKNIQSAVFSECVYAQTFANMFNLLLFVNCYENKSFIPDPIKELLDSYNLISRYAYSTYDKKRMLIQAGSCSGIDSALITVFDLNIYTIEFKEPGAKTSEPDLPKYNESGDLLVTKEFLDEYPQFKDMLNEQEIRGLNFFNIMGNNIHNFSEDSIRYAVSNNYNTTLLHVVCTEDKKGFLTMMPANQISIWAKIEGEIRPAGRNHYNVWTPNALLRFLREKDAIIKNNKVTISINKLECRRPRGGNREISGYKINPLFFVYARDCIESDNFITFNIDKVQQLNPTIAGKVFFKELKYDAVKKYYEKLL